MRSLSAFQGIQVIIFDLNLLRLMNELGFSASGGDDRHATLSQKAQPH